VRTIVVSGLLLIGVGAAAAACTAAGKQEAAQVVEAMDRFRKADNAAKPAMVATLRAVKCSAQDVCKTRDACLASAEATSKALKLKSEVEQGLNAVEKGTLPKESPEAKALGTKLDDAESLLKEGFAALPACDDQIMALKRTYQL
jgi:hypothetical protein